MPHPLHRRRRRSSQLALRWLAFGIGVGMALLGVPLLAGFLYLTPPGRTLVMVLTATAALLAFLVIACVVGRIFASAFNFVGEVRGRYSLEKFVREHRSERSV